MKRRVFVGGAFAGVGLTGAYAQPPKARAGAIPKTLFGKTGEKVDIIAQGGARMDLHPTVAEAAAHVRRVYDLGLTYFDCARSYWGGKSEEAYGIGLEGVRKNVFLDQQDHETHSPGDRAGTGRLAEGAQDRPPRHLADARCSHEGRDRPDPWSRRGDGGIRGREEGGQVPLHRIHGPLRSRDACRVAEGLRSVGFRADAVHAADHAYLSFEKTALPVAIEKGIGIQGIKVFCKAFLLRALSPRECLEYTLSMGVHVAVCGAGTQGQMEDNIRTAQAFKPLTAADLADIRKRAVVGQGVYTGPGMEYWKKA